MPRGVVVPSALLFSFAVLSAAAVPAARAQEERPDDVVGTITRVRGDEVTVRTEAGAEVRIRVGSGTQVSFRDAGDRREFPNPTADDLREGMGVRFAPGTTSPTRIVVHLVPEGVSRRTPRGSAAAAPPSTRSESRMVKARIQQVDRREIRADVGGRSTTYTLDPAGLASRYRAGDLVVLTVEGSGGREVVTRIDGADLRGTVTRADSRSVTIRVDGRDETYQVEDRDVLRDVREGDRVRFEVEERSGGRRVVTVISRER